MDKYGDLNDKTTEELNEIVDKEYNGKEKEVNIYDNYEIETYIQGLLDEKEIDCTPDELRRLATAYYAELVELGYGEEDYMIDNDAKTEAFENALSEVIKRDSNSIKL